MKNEQNMKFSQGKRDVNRAITKESYIRAFSPALRRSGKNEQHNYTFIYMPSFYTLLKRMHWSLFLIYGLLIVILSGSLVAKFIPDGSFSNPVVDSLMEQPYAMRFVLVVIFGPFIETILFQSLPFYFFRWFTKGRLNFWLCLLVGSGSFAAIHPYSIYYALMAGLMGAYYIHLYYLGKFRRQSAFALVFAVHALNNLLATIADGL